MCLRSEETFLYKHQEKIMKDINAFYSKNVKRAKSPPAIFS